MGMPKMQVLIPTATILGNFLVIISVLRFKALHSAINFLILGLAVADLMVALFVMPYAVYVYVSANLRMPANRMHLLDPERLLVAWPVDVQPLSQFGCCL